VPTGRYSTDGTGQFDARVEWPPHPRRLLEAHAVFDTNVPMHLAIANRCQMLRKTFAGRAHIPDRVRGELMGLAEGNAAVRHLYVPDWFAEIHRLDRAGRERAHDRQVAWHGASAVEADPSKDRGEAECHELAAQNPGWVLVSQDSNAIHHGRINHRPVFALPDVLIVFAAKGECLAENAWTLYAAIVATDDQAESRYWPLDQDAKDLFLRLAEELRS
jgi:hypothetical protein